MGIGGVQLYGEIVQGRAKDGLLKIFSKLYRSRSSVSQEN
jgi:hypothetical protein